MVKLVGGSAPQVLKWSRLPEPLCSTAASATATDFICREDASKAGRDVMNFHENTPVAASPARARSVPAHVLVLVAGIHAGQRNWGLNLQPSGSGSAVLTNIILLVCGSSVTQQGAMFVVTGH